MIPCKNIVSSSGGQLASGTYIPPGCFFIHFFKEDDTMKIEKLPSSSHRIRKIYKGKTYTVVFDQKPTQKEAIKAMSNELEKIQSPKAKLTFGAAAGEYVDMKRNVLSPRTVKEYSEMSNRFPEWFCKLPISDISQI